MKAHLLASFAALGVAMGSYLLAAVEHKTIGDAVSPDLAKAVGVDEDVLRPRLEEVLHRGWQRRGVIRGIPWILISACFFRSYWKAPTDSKPTTPSG